MFQQLRDRHRRIRQYRHAGTAVITFVVAVVALLTSTASAAASTGGSASVAFQGAAVSVPSSWPVIDLRSRPDHCARADVAAVYLDHQAPDARCPAGLRGTTESVQLEPLDGRVDAAARLATSHRSINGHAVRLDPASDTSHRIVVAIDGAGVLLTVTYRADRSLGERIVASLTLTGARPAAWPRGGGSAPGGAAPAASAPAAATAAAPAASAAAAPAVAGDFVGRNFAGRGFDTCSAPATGTMRAWLRSPYRAVGIYIGGANRACPDGNLSASWLATVMRNGWRPIPIYVGLQAPCNAGFATIDPASADAQGAQAADDAAVRAQGFGLRHGTPLFDDMEAYARGGSCTAAVMTFLAAWTRELHVRGYTSGVYSSLASGIADLVATPAARPDDLWFAHWDGVASTKDPSIPSSLWARHQRIKQYVGGHDETYGGQTINIDNDQCDFGR